MLSTGPGNSVTVVFDACFPSLEICDIGLARFENTSESHHQELTHCRLLLRNLFMCSFAKDSAYRVSALRLRLDVPFLDTYMRTEC
jgi:hypothetical protein